MDSEETQLRRIESGKVEPPLDLAHAATVHIPGVELGAQLGRGGMAVVYEARDYRFKPPRTVAVKLMDPSLTPMASFARASSAKRQS